MRCRVILLLSLLTAVTFQTLQAQVICSGNPAILVSEAKCPVGRLIHEFSDEFDGSVLDTSKWRVKTGVTRDPNQEQACQWFLPENAKVSDGKLIMVVKR